MWSFFLIGTLFLQIAAAQSAEDFKIKSLPGIDVDTLNFSMHAGLIPVEHSTSSLFFWRIESEQISKKTVFWLNGGPGCSSMDGLFLENGPLRIHKDQSIHINPGGWQRYATITYVDQPIGTGFSVTKNGYLHRMDELMNEFMIFLDNYAKIFPSIYDEEIYLAGESYAGIYIPYYAMSMLKRIKEDSSEKYNLRGLMIGNGWISPKHQYPAYYDFAIRNNLVRGGFIKEMSDQMRKCVKDIKKENLVRIDSCEDVFSIITSASVRTLQDGKKVCVNAYDKRLINEEYNSCGADWPHEGSGLQSYLRRPEVMEAIHVQGKNISWSECDDAVYGGLKYDRSEPSYHLLPIILKDIPVMLFSGDQDIICNHIGTEYLIGNMTWNDERGFSGTANKIEWKLNGYTAGYTIEDRGLSYALVKDASHMAPYDKPMEMLSLFKKFLGISDNYVIKNMAEMKYRLDNERSAIITRNSKRDLQRSMLTEKNEKVNDNQWPQYYYWGTGILMAMSVYTLSLCCCWYYKRRVSEKENIGSTPLLSNDISEECIIKRIKNKFTRRNAPINKIYLNEKDLSDELLLVDDHPALFEIDDGDDSDAYSETLTSYNKF